MPYFVVINEAGQHWDNNRKMREQRSWNEHAAFMDALEAERFVVLGGPLGNYPKHRAMLIVRAPNEEVLRKRLGEDPWMRSGILQPVEIYSWEILLGKTSMTL